MADIIIFTPEADIILSNIIKENNLEQFNALVKIDFVSKGLAKGETDKKMASEYLQKELGVSKNTADQITNKIIEKIIPLLAKAPEEKLKNPESREEISKKVFGEKTQEPATITSAVKPPIDTSGKTAGKSIKEIQTPVKKTKILKENSKLPKKPIQPERPKSSGSDSYREPIA